MAQLPDGQRALPNSAHALVCFSLSFPARQQLLWWRPRCNNAAAWHVCISNNGFVFIEIPLSFYYLLICSQSCNHKKPQQSALEAGVRCFSEFKWRYIVINVSSLCQGAISGHYKPNASFKLDVCQDKTDQNTTQGQGCKIPFSILCQIHLCCVYDVFSE